MNKLWPIEIYDESDQPAFLFMLTLPYSGSTAISQIINTANKTMLLQERGEGQWLIDGMISDRWNKDKYINVESLRSTWLRKYQETKKLVGQIDLVIEKSPPNILRYDVFKKLFSESLFFANNRNPYAYCSSVFYRHYYKESLSEIERNSHFRKIAVGWVNRSGLLREYVSFHKVPFISYEEFCDTPSRLGKILEASKVNQSIIDSIDYSKEIKVKDYSSQKISNQNERQIARLEQDDLIVITNVLNNHLELLHFFGYQVL